MNTLRTDEDKALGGDLFSSYGELIARLLPLAARIELFDARGEEQWTRGETRVSEKIISALIEPIISGSAVEPGVSRVSATLAAVAVPVVVDSKPVAILVAHVIPDPNSSDRQIVRDVVGATMALLDCLCRELGQLGRKTMRSATISERTEELEWLFALAENLHSNSNDSSAIQQLLSAAVDRMKSCFGAVVAPEHDLKLTHSSQVRPEERAAGAFESIYPHLMSLMRRRRQPLVENQVRTRDGFPSFKVLIVPIEPHKDKLIGYIAFLKTASMPHFGRRQLFLGRHIARQIGALLESQYDLATGLLTRSAFEEDVNKLMKGEAQQCDRSLMYFDIDRLHVVNDTMGFDAGDEAIVRIADLFRPPMLPNNALASRIGGDSFVVYLPDHDADQAHLRAQQILAAAAQSCVGRGNERARITLSCGIVRLYPMQSGLGGALGTAQLACKSAEEHGGNRAEIYLDVDDSMTRRRHDVFEVARLRNALAEDRFSVYAQKIVSAKNHSGVRGIECLLRMLNDEGKMASPTDFMPAAQRYQMLQAIDNWVIAAVLKQLKPYHPLLLSAGMKVAINISGQSIQDEAFIEVIERWLGESQVAPGLIEFEITETVAISNLSRAERLIRRLRERGCRFALDDFGMGVNSLSYLKSLPVTTVKIDGTFTRDLLSNDRSDVMVQTIVRMSRSLGIECIAECVESTDIAERLNVLGVDYVQGFFVHVPEPLQPLLESMKEDESMRLRQLYLVQ